MAPRRAEQVANLRKEVEQVRNNRNTKSTFNWDFKRADGKIYQTFIFDKKYLMSKKYFITFSASERVRDNKETTLWNYQGLDWLCQR